MKKLFFASIVMLATLTSCQSEMQNDLISNEKPTNSNYGSKTFAKAEDEDENFDPYKKDGLIYIAVTPDGVPHALVNGEFWEKSNSKDAQEAIQTFRNSETAKARVICSHHNSVASYGFVNVNGSTWMVVLINGHEYAWQVPAPSWWDCTQVYLGIYDVQIPLGPGVY